MLNDLLCVLFLVTVFLLFFNAHELTALATYEFDYVLLFCYLISLCIVVKAVYSILIL